MANANEARRPPGHDELPAATSPFSSEQLRRLDTDPPHDEIQESVVTNEQDGTEETYYFVRRGYIIREFNEIFGAGNWSQIVHSETVPVGDRALALRTDLTLVIQAGKVAAAPLTLSATSERLVVGKDLRHLQGERAAIEAHALKRVAALLGRRFGLGFYPGGDERAPDDPDEPDDAAPGSPEPLPPQARAEPFPIAATQRPGQAARTRPTARAAQAASADGPASRLPEILAVYRQIAERRGVPQGHAGNLMTAASREQFAKPPSGLTEQQQEQLLAAALSARASPPSTSPAA